MKRKGIVDGMDLLWLGVSIALEPASVVLSLLASQPLASPVGMELASAACDLFVLFPGD